MKKIIMAEAFLNYTGGNNGKNPTIGGKGYV